MNKTGILITAVFASLLASCTLFGNHSSPTCKELKKQMIFTGATSDRTTALQQEAQSGGLSRAYRDEGC
ncbi:MAG: hypothetical protein SFW66_03935 [Gammaproteobacteria bacterium]|nr:hypothetical protein [Gammaproteobacteria bacterium]